jgi:hypothetical protein
VTEIEAFRNLILKCLDLLVQKPFKWSCDLGILTDMLNL